MKEKCVDSSSAVCVCERRLKGRACVFVSLEGGEHDGDVTKKIRYVR